MITSLILFNLFSFNSCWDVTLHELEGKDLKEFNSRLLLFPGTKWCGMGNAANDYDDLGSSPEADMCCRSHDLCDQILPAGSSEHGLTNYAFYTRLSCNCDNKFYECLQSAKTSTSSLVGITYFTVLDTKCFREDYPVTDCKNRTKIGHRCLEYEYDLSQPKKYQWFDVPYYTL